MTVDTIDRSISLSALPEHSSGPRRWRGSRNRRLPSFDTPRVHGVCLELRREILRYLYDSLRDVLQTDKGPGTSLKHQAAAMRAVEASRYGAIYWLTTSEARLALLDGTGSDAALLDEYGDWLSLDSRLHKIWCGAVRRFLTDSERRHLVTDSFVPVEGFQPLGRSAVCIRPADLTVLTDSSRLPAATLDLHDFAHQAAASLCPEVYGNRFHTPAFRQLPPQLVDLVAGFESGRTPQHADGTMFGGFLSHVFNRQVDLANGEAEIVDHLRDSIVPYLMGEAELYLPSKGASVRPDRGVNVYELAVLAQNKSYELPASELEQLMFTRGGTDGQDPLERLTIGERIEMIARIKTRTFHEARNTLKHRAHLAAYQRVVEELWRLQNLTPGERKLAARIFRHINFEDHRSGLRRDLFRDVATELRKAGTRVLGDYAELA